jgi:alginate O-acetyltransferase complex protein AlgI
MDFTKPTFLFLFLPSVIIIHSIVKEKYRNIIVLVASLIFYASANWINLPIIIISIFINYYLGRSIEANLNRNPESKHNSALTWGIIFNIALLFIFKFIASYGSTIISGAIPDQYQQLLKEIVVPIGLSYITFQNISYLVDISNEVIPPARNFIDFSLYILLFPKIIIGPIVLYRQVCDQINHRELEIEKIANSARRFIIGLAKKVLIADTIARTINPGLDLTSPDFSTGIAWFILIGYTIQIFFDFSGYTDMALGLAGMLGFSFVENFNYPYIAESITNFWRRWHISLSNWVREYIFTPLEFKRRKSNFLRQQTNLLITFLLTGLWHGISLNFILWGGIHGLMLGLESSFPKFFKKLWKPLRHIYTLAIVMFSWIFFRSNSTDYALRFIGRLFGSNPGHTMQPFWVTEPLPIIDHTVWIALALGILFSIPIFPKLKDIWNTKQHSPAMYWTCQVTTDILHLVLYFLSVASIASAGYVGSIYGNF